MFDLIKKIISGGPAEKERGKGVADKTHLAAGVLLLETAHIDDECTAEEMAHVIDTLRSEFNFPQEYVEELIELAGAERDKAFDLWQFTNQMNQHYSMEEKTALMEAVWRIIFADGRLEAHEDHFAHKLANLLRLTHKQLIDAKMQAKAQLAD
ncbi:MAG: TerB family tellurite resistance protein [Proteobacteria bacterium]|nr:TerB family tellurite resistance protein [Pseudomonadota bacterium]MBU0965564.1 TerB family tellurite resistance protein [Pseudomonadota bacterium]